MKNFLRDYKYFGTISCIVFAYLSFTGTGYAAYWCVWFAFGLIPSFELVIKYDEKNLSIDDENLIKDSFIYDLYLWMMVPFILHFHYLFLMGTKDPTLTRFDMIGRTLSLSVMNIYSINMGHELGHRSKLFEKNLARILFLLSMIMHFFIEHVRGHHVRIGTDEDPASAKKGENVYGRGLYSLFATYFSAWGLEKKRLQSHGLPFIHYRNEMIWYQIIQILTMLFIIHYFGLRGGLRNI